MRTGIQTSLGGDKILNDKKFYWAKCKSEGIEFQSGPDRILSLMGLLAVCQTKFNSVAWRAYRLGISVRQPFAKLGH